MRMMVISFIIILLAVLVWGWFHFTSIDIVTSYYWENLILLSNYIEVEKWDNADQDMRIYFEKWQEVREKWIYFINQKDIDSIDASIRKLATYINNRNKSMAQSEIEELRVLFNVIKENECLSWENVF